MDEMFTEKTMAADSMNEPPQYDPRQYQPPQYDPRQHYMPQYPQQYEMYDQPAGEQPVRTSKAAKVFSIISFVFGCIAACCLLVLLMNTTGSGALRSSSAKKANDLESGIMGGIVLSIPGLVFGITAMAKKTTKFPLALLGTIFCGVYLLYCFVAATVAK